MNTSLTKKSKNMLKDLKGKRCAIDCLERLSESEKTAVFEERRRALASEVEAAEMALASLSGTQRELLNRFYIEREEGFLDGMCSERCCQKSTLYRSCRMALRAFTVAMFGSDA